MGLGELSGNRRCVTFVYTRNQWDRLDWTAKKAFVLEISRNMSRAVFTVVPKGDNLVVVMSCLTRWFYESVEKSL